MMEKIKVLRACKHWEKAGAAYVRIEAMARQHQIPLYVEFDEIDEDPDTKHIVLLDDIFPVATCRMFEEEEGVLHIGRVIVIPEYRKKGLGIRVVKEAELWAKDLGYQKIVLDSRDVAVTFYGNMGYTADYSHTFFDTFACIRMEKSLINPVFQIRPAWKDEYSEVKTFYDTLIDKMQAFPYHPKWEKDIYPSGEYLRESINQGEMYLALIDGTIVSAMILNHNYNESYDEFEWPTKAEKNEMMVIHALGVDPDHFRKEIAKKMVRYSIALAKYQKLKAIRLDVLEGNVPAEKLYPSLGFSYLHTLKMFYEDTGWMNFELYEYNLENDKKSLDERFEFRDIHAE